MRDLSALGRAAEHVLMRRDVRVAGIAAATFGGLALATSSVPPAVLGLQICGGAVAVAGAWAVFAPRPAGLLGTGAGLAILGTAHLVAGGVALDASTIFAWQILGFWQLVWGVQALMRYRRFAGTRDAVAPADVEMAARMLSDLRRARPRTSPDVIQFELRGGLPVLAWARLTPDAAVCLIGAGDARVVARDAFELDVLGEARRGTAFHVRVRLGDRTLHATIAKDLLERFEAWKGDLAHPESLAA